jgi:hypothetical protein
VAHVLTGAYVCPVDALLAEDAVVAQRALGPVVIVAGEDQVVALRTVEPVWSGSAAQDIRTRTTDQGIMRRSTARRRVVRRSVAPVRLDMFPPQFGENVRREWRRGVIQ